MTHLLRRIALTVLALGVVAGSLVAWRTEAGVPGGGTAGATGDELLTPVLSVRRVPTLVGAPVAERRLLTELGRLAEQLPAGACLTVSGPDLTFAHRADEPLVPASTLKLLTATAALEQLEPTTRFRTTVVAPAAPAADGVVHGDLTLVGAGDPLLATADYVSRFPRQPQLYTDLDALAADVARAGVRQVTGAVVGDESRYDSVRYVAGWPARYIDQGSIGPLSALAVNDGFSSYPTSDDRGRPLRAAPQPAVEAAAVLTRLLEARGVDVGGAPTAGIAPASAIELAGIESPPLLEIVGQLLRESDNNTAELLLKELGRGSGPGSTAGGATVVATLGEELGGGARVVDGSGLSLDDRVTCQVLLDALLRPGTGEQLSDLLPVAGVSGTLADRFEGTDLEGVLRAKTGSLTSVAALAGIVEDDDPPLTFALVVNAPGALSEEVADLQRKVAEALVRWPSVPDLAALGPRTEDG